jgi:hypothetical protein
MVMGQKPYDTKTISNFQLQSKIVNENLALTNTIWDTSIQKATHKKLESRYTSAQLFLNDLQKPESIKDDKTIFEKTDDKTIFENKAEATIIENNKTQNITPKEEKAQPTSNTTTANVEKAKKKPIGVIIGVIAGVVLLIVILIATSGPSQEELPSLAQMQADSTTAADAAINDSSEQVIMWEGSNSQGILSSFQKISGNEWIEINSQGKYYYTETDYENGNYTLEDKNRNGVLIYLSDSSCYYRDNNSTEWSRIYNGIYK